MNKVSQFVFDKDLHIKILSEIGETENFVTFFDRYIEKMYNSIESGMEEDEFRKSFVKTLNIDTNDEVNEKLQNHSKNLEENVDMAKTAIEKQDKDSLEKVMAEIKRMQKELNELNEELYRDELTKCYNRKYVKKIVDSEEKFKGDGAFVIVDFDKFKHINDTYGHITGDRVLMTISHLIHKTIRENNLVDTDLIRYGGDEFFIVHYGTSGKILETVMKKLQDKLSRMKFKDNRQNIEFKANFSFGTCSFNYGEKFRDVLNRADKDLYKQKEERKKLGLR